jgi:hypothetical protein
VAIDRAKPLRDDRCQPSRLHFRQFRLACLVSTVRDEASVHRQEDKRFDDLQAVHLTVWYGIAVPRYVRVYIYQHEKAYPYSSPLPLDSTPTLSARHALDQTLQPLGKDSISILTRLLVRLQGH